MEVKNIVQHIIAKSNIYIGSIKTYKSQDNFAILDALKMGDDVILHNLQEKIFFHKCNQALIQLILPHISY